MLAGSIWMEPPAFVLSRNLHECAKMLKCASCIFSYFINFLFFSVFFHCVGLCVVPSAMQRTVGNQEGGISKVLRGKTETVRGVFVLLCKVSAASVALSFFADARFCWHHKAVLTLCNKWAFVCVFIKLCALLVYMGHCATVLCAFCVSVCGLFICKAGFCGFLRD